MRSRIVTLTATVSSSSATGNVIFYDGDRRLGSSAVSSGKATLTTDELNVAANAVTAVYGGDASFAGSFSPVVVVYRSPKPR